jgi:hypothetical protein
VKVDHQIQDTVVLLQNSFSEATAPRRARFNVVYLVVDLVDAMGEAA